MPNPENLVGHEFKTGYDPRREGNGRTKGSKNLKTMLTELLSSQDPDGEWSKSVGGQLIRKAFKDGDMRALQEIIDRIEGKVSGGALVDQSQHIHNTKIDKIQIPVTLEKEEWEKFVGRLNTYQKADDNAVLPRT